MTREFIKGLLPDITDEKLEQIMTEHGKDVQENQTAITALTEERDKLQGQLETAQAGLKAFEGVDVDDLKGQIKKLQDDMAAQADSFRFDALLDGAIRDAKGRNVKAVRALLDMDSLRASKDQTTDIKTALEKLAESDSYLFENGSSDQQVTGMTVSTGGEHGTGLSGAPEPKNLAEAIKYEEEKTGG